MYGNARARDVVVTGMGFCLPGNGQPVRTAVDLWDVASNGRSHLACDGVYHGTVKLTSDEFAKRIPEIPGTFSQHFTAAHRFGILSLAEAAADAGLDYVAGDLA